MGKNKIRNIKEIFDEYETEDEQEKILNDNNELLRRKQELRKTRKAILAVEGRQLYFEDIGKIDDYLKQVIFQNTLAKEEGTRKTIGEKHNKELHNLRYSFAYIEKGGIEEHLTAREFNTLKDVIVYEKGEMSLMPLEDCVQGRTAKFERDSAKKLVEKGFLEYKTNKMKVVRVTNKIFNVKYTVKTTKY